MSCSTSTVCPTKNWKNVKFRPISTAGAYWTSSITSSRVTMVSGRSSVFSIFSAPKIINDCRKRDFIRGAGRYYHNECAKPWPRDRCRDEILSRQLKSTSLSTCGHGERRLSANIRANRQVWSQCTVRLTHTRQEMDEDR